MSLLHLTDYTKENYLKLKTYILLDGKIEFQVKIGNLHIAPYHRSLAPASPSSPEKVTLN